MINIIRKGIWPIPDEAKKCPVCGEYAQHYSLENLHSVPLRIANSCCNLADPTQKYPTFHCEECQTIWQYLGEKEEEEQNE